jgi:hypothetical protein
MAQAVETLCNFTNISNINQGEEWVRVPKELSHMLKVIVKMSPECRQWPNGSTEKQIQLIIHENSSSGDVIIYTNGSVLRGVESGWGLVAKVKGKVVAKENRVYETTISCMRMEVDLVFGAF